MKTGCIWAFFTWIGTAALIFFAAFVVEHVSSIRFGGEPFGEFVGRIALFFALIAFVVVWIRQANRKDRQSKTPPKPLPVTPEKNLQPIDYSKLSHLYDDDQKG